jgi:hypothetical protein
MPVPSLPWRRPLETVIGGRALRVDLLHQHSAKSDPMDPDFNYAAAFKSLDLKAVKQDLAAVMTDPALVARRLRSLRPAVYPHGLA